MIRIYSLSAACLLATGVAVAAEPSPDDVRKFVKQLQSDDAEQRLQALEALTKAAHTAEVKSATPRLRELLRSEEGLYPRVAAGGILAQLGEDADAVVPVLLDVVRAQHPAGGIAIHSMTAYGWRAILPLRAALKNAERRGAAIQLLSDLDETFEPLVPDVVQLLKEGELDGTQVSKFFRRHRRAAAGPLAALLTKDDAAADRAASVLCDFGEDAVPALADLVQEGSPAARRRAGSILYHQSNINRSVITPATADIVIAGMARLAGDTDVEVRRKAIVMLCRLGQPGAPEVLEALRDRDVHIRLAACDAIARRGSDVPATVHIPLIERLDDPDPLIRVEAAEALLTLQPDSPRMMPVLLAGLWDNRGDVRYRALVAVYRMGEDGRFAGVALPNLRWFDPDRRVRRLAARMIRRMEEEGRQ